MKAGDRVKTNDRLDGRIVVECRDDRWLVETMDGAVAVHSYYLGWQLTPIEEPPIVAVCRRLQWAWRIDWTGAYHRCDDSSVGPAYAVSIPTESLYICDHAKECVARCWQYRKEPHTHHEGEHPDVTCGAGKRLRFQAKCIPYQEERDWFVVGSNGKEFWPVDQHSRPRALLTKREAKELAKLYEGHLPIGTRYLVFKWSQGE